MKTRKQKHNHVDHHHFLLRLETKSCPLESDKAHLKGVIHRLLQEIQMEPLDEARVYYQKTPKWNEGLTGIAPITTSHVAFHFWRYPQKSILQNPTSKFLLQFDIYTCGSLTTRQIKNVLKNLTEFEPTHLSALMINRKKDLSIDAKEEWDVSSCSWEAYCKDLAT